MENKCIECGQDKGRFIEADGILVCVPCAETLISPCEGSDVYKKVVVQ